MKSKKFNLARMLSYILFLAFFAINSAFAQSPEGINCTDCKCKGVFCSCSTGRCCEPYQATCDCGTFRCDCDCIKGVVGRASIGIISENVVEFANYLRSPEFSSSAANSLAQKMDALLLAASNNNHSQYITVGDEAEAIAYTLPASEKQKANLWIQSKGGSTLIPD